MKWLANERGGSADESTTRNSEPMFYTRNKDGQYEIWPPQRKIKWGYLIGLAVILAIGCLTAII